MGDRKAAEIMTPTGAIYFYTHWYGSDLDRILRDALDYAAPRKGDPAYACRHVCVEPYEMAWLEKSPVEVRRDGPLQRGVCIASLATRNAHQRLHEAGVAG